MKLARGRYYICFLDTSNPSEPNVEKILKMHQGVLAFPVAGSIDAILISKEKILETCEEYELLISNIESLNDQINYAFLHYESSKEDYHIYKDKRILYFRKNNERIVLVEYRLNRELDDLWQALYRKSKLIAKGTYVVFTTKYAQHS